MRTPRAGWMGALLLAAAVGAGCSSGVRSSPPAGTTPPPANAPAAPATAAVPGAGTVTASAPASAAEFDAIFRARMDSARMRFTPADVSFMTGMIAHHAQALVMSALVAERTQSPAMRILAGRITNAQQDEIATMQQWLRDRAQKVPEVHMHGTEVMLHGVEHAHMPGMLTDEQLKQLAAARGVEFERLFLQYMIQHHRGAVTMVQELFATDGAGQDEAVFKFASDVQVDQTTEIDRMERMLAALGGNAR